MSKTSKTIPSNKANATLIMTFRDSSSIYKNIDNTYYDANGQIEQEKIDEYIECRKASNMPLILEDKPEEKPELFITFENGDNIYRTPDGKFYDDKGFLAHDKGQYDTIIKTRTANGNAIIDPRHKNKTSKATNKDNSDKPEKGKPSTAEKSESWVKNNRNRSYCFTLNNYTVFGICKLLDNINPDYFIVGFEIAPTTGIPHLRGYFYKKDKITRTAVNKHLNEDHPQYNKKTIPKDIDDDDEEEYEESHAGYYWVKNAKKDFKENFCYCTKGLDWLECDPEKRPQQGKRNDIIVAQQQMDSGVTTHIKNNHCSVLNNGAYFFLVNQKKVVADNIVTNTGSNNAMIASNNIINLVPFGIDGIDGIDNLSGAEMANIIHDRDGMLVGLLKAVNFNADKPEHHNLYYYDDRNSIIPLDKNVNANVHDKITSSKPHTPKNHNRSTTRKKSKIRTLSKTQKQRIPQSVRIAVWNKYIGDDVRKAKCSVGCGTTIDIACFACAHVIAESNGGLIEIPNLRPICTTCNSSMGTQNLEEFRAKYKFGE